MLWIMLETVTVVNIGTGLEYRNGSTSERRLQVANFLGQTRC